MAALVGETGRRQDTASHSWDSRHVRSPSLPRKLQAFGALAPISSPFRQRLPAGAERRNRTDPACSALDASCTDVNGAARMGLSFLRLLQSWHAAARLWQPCAGPLPHRARGTMWSTCPRGWPQYAHGSARRICRCRRRHSLR